MRSRAIAGGVVALCLLTIGVASARTSDPLTGRWILNLARTHYGPGVDTRTKETFTCEATKTAPASCQIDSVRTDGRALTAKFAAAYDGKPYPVVGMPDMDRVVLQRVDDSIADATFSFQGKPVFAYRAFRASDGRSLTIVSVDPVSHAVLNSVVVYDAR